MDPRDTEGGGAQGEGGGRGRAMRENRFGQTKVNLKKINPVIGNVSVGGSGGATNDKPVGAGDAILWWLCCMPIGFSQWNQAAKGWLWLVIALLTGFGGIICLVDYILCYQAQKKRKLDEWEFFPSAYSKGFPMPMYWKWVVLL